MRERDPTQQAIDGAVIAAAAEYEKKQRRELAVELHNALVAQR